jgi:hypothetical protein
VSDSGHTIGENNPYHSNFNGSLLAELATRDDLLAALTAERDELARKLAEAEKRFEYTSTLSANRGVYLSEYFDSVTEAGIEVVFQDGDEVTGAPEKLLQWVKAAKHRADAAEAKVRELQKAIHGEHEWSELSKPDCDIAMPTVEDSCLKASDVRESEKLYRRLVKEKVAQLAQLQAKLAAVREAVDSEWKKAEEERLKETDEHHAEAAKWKAEDDMYGWNFYEGVASGTIGVSFIYHRMVRAIADLVKA